MKNSRIYLGFIFILLLAIAFKLLPSKAENEGIILSQETEELKLDRLTINLTVESLEEIKVREGDKIIKNQIIATNEREKELLLTQKTELINQLNLISQPIPIPPPPPAPIYSQENAMITSAKANLKYWESIPEPEFKYKDEYVPHFESETLTKLQMIAEKRNNAQFTLNSAIANLQRAKSNYQRELYNYELKLLSIDTEERRRLSTVLGVKEKIFNLEQDITQLDFISPYSGVIRRIKAQQINDTYNVTIELVNE